MTRSLWTFISDQHGPISPLLTFRSPNSRASRAPSGRPHPEPRGWVSTLQISCSLGIAAPASNPPIYPSTRRMYVAYRGLRVPRSSRVFHKVLPNNELRCRCEASGAPWRPVAVQCHSFHRFRNTARDVLSESRNRRYSTLQHFDTIYALSSGAGRAAIAVIRVSGLACRDVSFSIRHRPIAC